MKVHALSVWFALLVVSACGGPRETPAPVPAAPAPVTAAGAAPAAAPSGPPRLLVLSAMNGYVEPCGCTIDLTLGGIDKTVRAIEAERRQGPTAVLVVGATLFDPEVDDAHLADQETAKAEVLGRALSRIGVDAWVPTPTELKYGAAVYAAARGEARLPDATVNVSGGQPRLLALGDLRVGVFGLASPESGATPAGHPSDPEPAAREATRSLRAQGAQVVVGLAVLPRRALRTLARRLPEVDLWVLGDHANEEPQVLPAGPLDAESGQRPGYLIEAGDRGRHVARVLLHGAHLPGLLRDPVGDRDRTLRSEEAQLKMQKDLFTRSGDPTLAQRIEASTRALEALRSQTVAPEGKRLEFSLLPIDKALPADEVVTGWLTAYNARLKEINLASVAPVPPLPEGASGFAKGSACVECHEEAQAVWKGTPHARAWETLVKLDKTFDAECVSCHVTGWLAPGGVNLKDLRGMTDVQCEACHGPSADHVDQGGEVASTKRAVPAEVCTVCHNRFHSPKFDYATYLPKVLGPGHLAKE